MKFIAIFLLIIIFSSMLAGVAHASISIDKGTYSWTDKIHIRLMTHGYDPDRDDIRIFTSDHELNSYKLSKIGNGLYTGEVIMTGFLHDTDGDGKPDTNPRTMGTGSNNGFLETSRDDGLTVSLEFADGTVMSKSAKIIWNTGTIKFEKDTYENGDSTIVRVTDADMNLNPETLDIVKVQIFSDSDKAGIIVNAVETQEESGLFETKISFSQDTSSSGNRLLAIPGDLIYAKYDDHTLPSPHNIHDDLGIIAKSTITTDQKRHQSNFDNEILNESSLANLEWSQANYAVKNGTGTAKIIVADPEINEFPNNTDTLKVYIFSDSFRDGITLKLYETGKDTGIFERIFTFSDKRSAPNVLYAMEGDTVTAQYETISNPDLDIKSTKITQTMFLGLTGPPLERVPASFLRIEDSQGGEIITPIISTDKQIKIVSDLENQMKREQDFVYMVQIQDEKKVTISLSWITGMLTPLQTITSSHSWIPIQHGKYFVTVFVWESLDNPTALSPPLSLEIDVKD